MLKHILKNKNANKNTEQKETVLYLLNDVAVFSTKKAVNNNVSVNTPNWYIEITSKNKPPITPTHKTILFLFMLVSVEFLLKNAKKKIAIKIKFNFAL